MTEHLILGTRDIWGQDLPFTLSPADKRHHLYVIGKSGTGKTTLLRNLILQDIEAGRGVGVIDPHGDLAEEILDYIPGARARDVAYFDPADIEHPIEFNLLSKVPRDKRALVASGIVGAFRGVWPDFWGPRLEYILYATVAALLECENVSLMGIPRMLSDEQYRRSIVKQVKNPMVRSFWTNEFARYNKTFLQEAVAPIQNKVGQLLMAPELRNIFGQVRSSIDARWIMDQGKIFIGNLSKGKIGDDKTNLLGALWVTQFQLAAMSRANIPESERRDFSLYVDEFHSFISDSFTSILSEARKYRLGLTLSHQYLSQLKPGILDAVIGNVGSIVSFRIGHKDAEILESSFGRAFSASQFTSLDNGQVCAKLLSDGRDIEPFIGRTLAPYGTRHGRKEKIITRSRQRFANRREIVERRHHQWLNLPPD
jgi:hypothetical protein